MAGVYIDWWIHSVLRADAVKVLAAPTSALTAFLEDLNALDGLERPVEEALRGERDAFVRSTREIVVSEDESERESAAQKFADSTVEIMKNGFDQQIALVRSRDLLRAETGMQINMVKLFVRCLLHGDARSTVAMAGASLTYPEFDQMAYQNYTEMALNAEGRSDSLRVWLALELHRRKAGTRPATLAALVPRWLPAVPLDPFAPSRPMAYRDGRLWSVALDRRDGGGKPELPLYAGENDRVKDVRKVTKGDFVFLTAAGPR